MQLWNKGTSTNEDVLHFTVGNDYLLDHVIVKYDCVASKAHAKMLCKIGVLNEEELGKLLEGLDAVMKLEELGKFENKKEDEDCHTAIENYLVEKYGDVGKKIHTGRSRNDQVLTAFRLYEKAELQEIESMLKTFKKSLDVKNETPFPGYTHMQRAIPTTIGTWLGAYAASVEDNLELLDETLEIIDQSPLGSGVGFGTPVFGLDNEMTAKEMGFDKVQKNPMYAQMSRGKFEAMILSTLTQIMFDMNKLATDVITFNMKEFGFVVLPAEFCTGSSAMPQKKNPDVLELVRAKYSVVLGEECKVKNMIAGLISGYNRDVQLTKEPVILSFNTTKEVLHIMTLIMKKIKINPEACKKAMTPELYATEEAYKLVQKGMPFRDAYKEVGKKYS